LGQKRREGAFLLWCVRCCERERARARGGGGCFSAMSASSQQICKRKTHAVVASRRGEGAGAGVRLLVCRGPRSRNIALRCMGSMPVSPSARRRARLAITAVAVHASRAARGCGCRCGELAPRELRAAPRSYLWPRPPPRPPGVCTRITLTPSPAHTHAHTHTRARIPSTCIRTIALSPPAYPCTHILPLSECSLFSSSSCDLPGGIFSLLS
jgi:hypothetical protein